MRASFIILELSEKFLSLLRVNNMLSRHILSDVFFYVFEINFLSEYICYTFSISYSESTISANNYSKITFDKTNFHYTRKV